MKLDYAATVRAMSRALELLDGDHFTESEALRLAWLEQRELPVQASPQMQIPLKATGNDANSAKAN